MKQVFAHRGRAVLRDIAEPELRPGEVLVETAYSVISTGTELGIIQATRDPEHRSHEYPSDPPSWPKIRSGPRLHHPMPRPGDREYHALGYSLAGRVLAVHDDVTDVSVGDAVACSGSQTSHHAERVAVPRNLLAKIPDAVRLQDAAFITLGAIAMQSLRQTDCRFGESVVLFGVGLLGLLGGQIGNAAGLHTIGIDISPARLDQARQFGFGDTVNGAEENPVEAVQRLTDGFGADGVVLGVVTDSSEPLNQAFDMSRQRGRVVGLGVFGWEIDRARFYRNAVTLHSSRAYGHGRYDPVYEEGGVDYPIGWVRWTENRNQAYLLDLLRRGLVTVAPLAPEHVPFDQAPEAYDLLQSPERPPTVVFDYS